MLKYLSAIAFSAFIFASGPYAGPSLNVIFKRSLDSNAGCTQRSAAEAFAHLNGTPIYFTELPGFRVIYYNQIIESKSIGPFSQSLLLVGSNIFKISYIYGYGEIQTIKGSASAVFSLNTGTPQERILCVANFGNGSLNGYNCQTEVRLSLAEIDPQLASEIDRLRFENRRQLEELKKLEEMRPRTADLEYQLEEMAKRDFDFLDADAVSSISAELRESAALIRGFKTEIERLRSELARQLKEALNYISKVNQSVSAELHKQGINTKDPAFFQSQSVSGLTLPDIGIPELVNTPEIFDEHNNVYKTLADRTINRIERSVAKGSFADANLIIEAWSSTNSALGHALENRLGVAKLAEIRCFNQSTLRVKEVICKTFDDNGFLKAAPIPEHVKTTIVRDMIPEEPIQARALRDALNGWKDTHINAGQKLVLETITGLGAAYRAQKELAAEADKAAKESLRAILESTIEVAKDAARIGVGFTPVGRFVDFCEVVTGKEFCLPNGKDLSIRERAISAVGTLIGGGAFWRKLGGTLVSSGIEAVGKKAANIYELAAKHGIKIVAGPNATKVDKVIIETLEGSGDITSKFRLTANEGLDAGAKWVGPGYKETKPGSGVFQSMDGKRQFRIDRNSIGGKHSPNVPHIHFQEFVEGTMKDFKSNNHVPFID